MCCLDSCVSSACTLRATGLRSSPRCCLIFRCRRTASSSQRLAYVAASSLWVSLSCRPLHVFPLLVFDLLSGARDCGRRAGSAAASPPHLHRHHGGARCRSVCSSLFSAARLHMQMPARLCASRVRYGDWVSCLACVVSPTWSHACCCASAAARGRVSFRCFPPPQTHVTALIFYNIIDL